MPLFYAGFYAGMLAFALMINGCATVQPREEQAKNLKQEQDIVRAIRIIGPDKELIARAQKQLNTLEHVDVVPEDSFFDFTLILKSGENTTSEGLFDTTPPIVGMLEKQKKPTIAHLAYTLVDQEGDTFSQGEAVGMGDDKTIYFPSLKSNRHNAHRTQALQDGLAQLKKELAVKIRHAPLRAKVVTQLMRNNQVGVGIYPDAGLESQHTFHVRDKPEIQLRYAGVTRGIDGAQTHGLLEVMKGPMPELGAIVVLNPF